MKKPLRERLKEWWCGIVGHRPILDHYMHPFEVCWRCEGMYQPEEDHTWLG